MNNTVLLAVIFPANMPFFSAFIQSVKSQTDTAFDIIIGNDGVVEQLSFQGLSNVNVIPVSGTPIQTRLALIKEAQRRGYEKLIFSDTDDELSNNRVEVVKRLLDDAACVCNDVDLIDSKSNVLAKSFWQSRLSERQVIDEIFLTDKNVIGFGNTGFTTNAIANLHDSMLADVPAPDWLYFSLLAKNNVVLFTALCTTRYRQHADNLIGIKAITGERLQLIIAAKLKHYQALAKLGYGEKEKIEALKSLQQKISSQDKLLKSLNILKTLNINYFWWEETNYLV